MSEPRQVADILGRGVISLSARFVLLAALAVGLMLVDHRQHHLSRVRDLLAAGVYPIQLIVDIPFSTWEMLSESLEGRRSLMLENERLERELRIARVRQQTLESLQVENDRLRRMVDALESEHELEIRLADIMSVDLDNPQRFIINRGRNDGVYDCQPLLDADGVVGQVIQVSAMKSEALMITDASHSIHVANVRSGLRTIAEGTGQSRSLRLLFVTNEDDYLVGDLLVTTGYGGIFPAGRPVARVTEVTPQFGQDWAIVRAEPVAALDRIQEVLLVSDGDGPPDDCLLEAEQSFAGLVP